MAKRELVFWYSSIDPFMVERFNALSSSGHINFECWFSEGRADNRSWVIDEKAFQFPYRMIPNVRLGRQRTGMPAKALLSVRPRVMVSFHGHPLVAGSLLQHFLPGGKLVYYVEKTFDTWVARSRLKELAKHVLLSRADGFLSPGGDADAYIRGYATGKPIFRLNHVVNAEHFRPARVQRGTGASCIRKESLGLRGFVFLNIGRQWHQKGIGSLIDAFSMLERSGVDASLLLVGDGQDRHEFQKRVRALGLRRVKFMDFVQQDTLPEIYALADAFVFPTRGDPYGLVVDEAQAAGLPVIATTSAGEITTRVVEDISGFLVPADEPDVLGQKMMQLVSEPAIARMLGEYGFQQAQSRTTRLWVGQITEMLEQV